ncbi:hypothetical protein FACS189425_04300 [Clostridia bacterium]|nr:hypothetical protein FACS189425_04300 [Clostridia bacterium]
MKRTLSVVITLCLVLQLSLGAPYASALTPEGFAGGTGTPEDPWQITNTTQLNLVKSYLNRHFILQNNISLSGTWLPIGRPSHAFIGTFNGNNYTVSGLYAYYNYTSSGSSTNDDNVGFFGYTKGATIKNLKISGSVSGGTKIGSIIGYADSTITMENCSSSATVSASSTNSGGLIGYANDGDWLPRYSGTPQNQHSEAKAQLLA